MKNLFTLFAILLSLGITNAQTKKPVAKKTDTPEKRETPAAAKGPSLEETVAYINEILVSSLGVFDRGKDKPHFNYGEVTEQEFSLQNTSRYQQYFFDGKLYSKAKFQYSNIDWSSLTSIKIESREDLKELILTFNIPIRVTTKKDFGDLFRDGDSADKESTFYVIPEKAENLKKAFLHLKELTYKPDPFD